MLERMKPAMVAVLVMSLIVTAMASEPSFSYGMIRASCAPWDGPAIEIRLTTQPAKCREASEPYVSFAIWRGLPIHSGQVVNIANASGVGWAALCAKEGECKVAQSATIVFDKYEEGSSAAGHYELQFKSGEVLKGNFDVKWCVERVFCR